MKILYIAQERCAAQVAAHALRRIAPGLQLSWARTHAAALGWVRAHQDADAVLVESGRADPDFDGFLEQVRGLGLSTPIAAIAPEDLEALSTALEASPDSPAKQERGRREILEGQLRETEEWRRQAEQRLAQDQAQHDATLARTTRICTALQERLLELEAALGSADQRHAAQAAATEHLVHREAELSAAVAEAVALRAVVEDRLAEVEAARQDARQRAAETLRIADERCALLEDRLSREAAACSTLEERLAAVEIAREDTNRNHASELDALSTRLAESEAQHQAASARSSRICTALQQRLLELEAAIQAADEQHASDTAVTELLALREREIATALADAIAARTALEHRLSETETAHQRTDADLTLATQRCSAFAEQVTREATARSGLEQRAGDAERAREQAERQHAAEVASLLTRLSALQEGRDAAASRNAALERQVHQGGVLLEQVRSEWASEVAAVTDRLQQREEDLQALESAAHAGRTALERQLADAEAARQQSDHRSTADLAAAADRQAAVESRLAEALEARNTIEEGLSAARSALEEAGRRHGSELASLNGRLAGVRAQHEAAVSQHAAAERRLADAAGALEQARRDWSSEVAALTGRLQQREAELGGALSEACAARAAIENEFNEARIVHQQAQQRSAAELADAANRYSAVEGRLAGELSARTASDADLAAARSAAEESDRRHSAELASLTARLAGVQAQHEAALNQHEVALNQHAAVVIQHAAAEQQLVENAAAHERARLEWSSEIAALTDRLQQREGELGAVLSEAAAAKAVLEHELAEARAMHQEARQRSAAELADAAGRHSIIEGRLAEEVSARTALEQRLADTETAAREAGHHYASELASLTARLAGLQAQHETAVSQHTAAEQQLTEAAAALEQARRSWQADLSTAGARQIALEDQVQARGRDAARLQQESESVRRQLTAMRTHAAALRRHVERVPVLERQLDESRKENRKQFERAPYGLCQCTSEGVITRVNHSLARLLGYRTGADLQRLDVVAAVFESAADLRWLLDRTTQTGRVESVETTFKTADRRRLFVRLHAVITDHDVVIAVEDLTKLSAVEQRLREAQRMEAVGRVASEVAVTCDTLLHDVSQGGRQWLAGFESDTALRQQGELLLGDVRRAAGFLRQFVVYGHQQISNVEPVSLQRLLREMAPVLKRVLGDDISLLLPKTTDRLDVDLDAERVERILVNVANYARVRMPNGGRVKIHLATTVVDRQFLVNHPKVRPGAHVLITITEMQGAVWPVLPIHLRIGRAAHPEAVRAASDNPGMDLGPLLALISDSGGHLWMSAEPAGNMTLQIHLPRRTQDDLLEPAAPGRGRQLTRWFRH